MTMNNLTLLAINITERCNLACAHCYLDAKTLSQGSSGELHCSEICQLLSQVANKSAETMVVLTGGEPLLRKDLEQMVAHGSQLGLSMVVGTNGMTLTEKRVASLKESGLLGVGISVDSLDPSYHDNFRGMKGSLNKTLAGIAACRKHQLSFQIHFTVTEGNADELDDMVAFTKIQQARVLNIFFIVCTGRGESITNVGAKTYERVLQRIIELQKSNPDIIIRARCAPHFKRVAHQLDPQSQLNKISGFDGDGCIAGTSYCRVNSTGNVTACPYIEESAGNIHSQDFWSIWQNSEKFEALRNPTLEGRCGACEYQKLCGGCRARPKATLDNIMGSDPFWSYSP